jgi:aryl-alcohol dehydrogenase-like predicted oxidoreductase
MPQPDHLFFERFVLGTLHFALLEQSSIDVLLDRYFECGGRWIDTASFYGNGRVECTLGSYLKRHAPPVRISAKVGHFDDAEQYGNEKAISASLWRTIDRLGMVPEVVSLHEGDWAVWWQRHARVGAIVQSAAEVSKNAPGWQALREFCVSVGARCGLTGNNASSLLTAAATARCDQIMVAKQYDLVWRTAEELIAWASGLGIRVWCAAPFHQGALLNLNALRAEALGAEDLGLVGAIDTAMTILEGAGERVQRVAVPFLLEDERVAGVVVGLRSVNELEDALDAARRRLSPSLISRLRQIGVARPPRPGVASRPEYQ